ncbi:PT domain-containing protein [bacterium]|nr:PT domain-containing protein [bacterium]
MFKKNIFGFVSFVAVAGLGLSLMVSGCGTSGTVPYPVVNPTVDPTVEPTVEPTEEPTDEPTVEPTGEPTAEPTDEPTPTGNTITFNYEGIAAAVAKTAVPANIKTVKYAFVDEDYNVIGKTKTVAIENNLVVDDEDMASGEIAPEAVTATAVYYDADNKVVALGIDEISWTATATNSVGLVDNPTITELGDNYTFSVGTSAYVIKPGEGLNLTATVTTEGGETIDLTPFVEFTMSTGDGGDPAKVLVPDGSGAYTGGEYGIVEVSGSFEDGDMEGDLDGEVYVTDQTITGITVEPEDELTQVEFSDTVSGYPVVVVSDPMDQTGADFYDDNGNLTKTDVNTVPFIVKANYSNIEGKGPSPAGVDVTSDANIKVVFGDDTTGDPDVTVEGGSITVNGLTNSDGVGPDLFKVSASCTIDGKTVTTPDGKEVYLVGTKAGCGVVLTAKDPSAPQGVSMYGTAAPGDDVDLHLMGFMEGRYGVYYFEIPDDYVPETAPEASIDYVSPDGADLGEINPVGGDSAVDYTLGIDDETKATGASIGVDTEGTDLPEASVFTLTVEH